MATKLKHQEKPQQSAPQSNVIPLTRCSAEGCSKKTDHANFCNEHYDWFKFGLITRDGKRPSDFDKKFQAYKKNRAA